MNTPFRQAHRTTNRLAAKLMALLLLVVVAAGCSESQQASQTAESSPSTQLPNPPLESSASVEPAQREDNPTSKQPSESGTTIAQATPQPKPKAGEPTEPKDAKGFVDRGYSYYQKKDYQKAIADYTEAIHRDPKLASAYGRRAQAYQAIGKDDEAIVDAGNALELDLNIFIAYYSRGLAFNHKGDFDKAIENLSKAIEVSPTSPRAFHGRGNAYAGKGDHAQAIKDFTEAIRLDPKLSQAYRKRAAAFAKTGEKARSKADIQEAQRLEAEKANPSTGTQPISPVVSRPSEEAGSVPLPADNKKLQSRPSSGTNVDDGKPHSLPGDQSSASTSNPATPTVQPGEPAKQPLGPDTGPGQSSMPKTVGQQRIDDPPSEPTDGMGFYERGNAYFEKEDYDKAIADYTKAIELLPTYSWSYTKRGQAYNRKGEWALGKADLEMAIHVAASLPPGKVGRRESSTPTPPSNNAASDTPSGFSEEEWDQLIRKANQLGYARNRSEAARLAPALRTMKGVFVDAGIEKPSANQLFNGAKALTGGGCFVNFSPEKTDSLLRETILTGKLTGIGVASRAQLERLEYTSKP